MLYRRIIFFLFLILLIICPVAKGDAIDTIENNLGMGVTFIILLVLTGGIVVIAAMDARIALMIAFLLYGVVFIVFTLATETGYTDFNPYFAGVAMMVCFVLLALSLLITYKKSNSPPSVV